MNLPDHSPVGASGMFRWNMSACPGSVLAELEAGPDTDSFPAREGTCAHRVAELSLAAGISSAAFIDHVFHDVEVTGEMAEHVQGYVDFTRSLSGERHVEYKFHCPEIHDQCFSTSDLVAVDRATRTLRVADFKYGRVAVSAENNVQLMYYATGVLQSMNLWSEIDTVELTAYQPRLWGRLEPWETWAVPVADISQWAVDILKPSIELALSPDAPRKAGTHCKDCRAKLTCSAFLHSAMAVRGYTVPLGNAEIAQVLDMEKPLDNLIKDAKHLASTRLMQGQDIPGYKPVRQYGRSKIVNPEACSAELTAAGVTDIYEQKLKDITELKKNKLAKGIVTRHSSAQAGGIKAVPLSSTQPAVTIPSQAFTNEGL